MNNIAIVGAGIIGMTNAIRLLEQGFSVTVFTKDEPHNTNSDAAVANWFTPGDSKPILHGHCLESIPKFDELMKRESSLSGIQKIPLILYFESKDNFQQSVWAREPLKSSVNPTEFPSDQIKLSKFPYAVLINNLLIDPTIYRPYMQEKFEALGGKLNIKKINSLADLANDYDIVINSAGWEAKFLTQDPDVFPVRGQTETIKNTKNIDTNYAHNIEGMDAYVVPRPSSNDLVIGVENTVGSSDRKVSEIDKKKNIKKISSFFHIGEVETVSKAGVRCGRTDVRVEAEKIINKSGEKKLIVHCYGHGGCGYSASWGSADAVLDHCIEFTPDMKPNFRLSI